MDFTPSLIIVIVAGNKKLSRIIVVQEPIAIGCDATKAQ